MKIAWINFEDTQEPRQYALLCEKHIGDLLPPNVNQAFEFKGEICNCVGCKNKAEYFATKA